MSIEPEEHIEAIEFGKDLTLMGEVVVTGRKVGASRLFWSMLAHHQDLFEEVVEFVVNQLRPVFRLETGFKNDKASDCWQLLADSPAKDGEFIPELLPFFSEGEKHVSGNDMLRRAGDLSASCGQRHAEAVIGGKQYKIPQGWQGHTIIFPATIWNIPAPGYESASSPKAPDSPDSRRVPILVCHNGRWAMDFVFLARGFHKGCLLARPRIVE